LFASLATAVRGTGWLDLFAGTGAVGIEALSRGGSHCTFIDRSPKAVAAISANLERASLTARATIETADVARYLGRPAPSGVPFEMVFLDPPYDLGDPYLGGCLVALSTGWLAAEGWTVILTRGHKGPWPAVPVHWAVWRQLRYGDSLITLYREERWA